MGPQTQKYLAKELLKFAPDTLKLEAKVSYLNGQAVLSVYGFLAYGIQGRPHVGRVNLQSVFVPRDMFKAEKARTLRCMCDLVALGYGMDYRLRSKIIGENKGVDK